MFFFQLIFFSACFFPFNKTWLYGAICIVLLIWSTDTDLSEPFLILKTEFHGILPSFTECYRILISKDSLHACNRIET